MTATTVSLKRCKLSGGSSRNCFIHSLGTFTSVRSVDCAMQGGLCQVQGLHSTRIVAITIVSLVALWLLSHHRGGSVQKGSNGQVHDGVTLCCVKSNQHDCEQRPGDDACWHLLCLQVCPADVPGLERSSSGLRLHPVRPDQVK